MPEFEEVELVDTFIYLYVSCGCISIVLSTLFLFVVFKNWRNASRAVNPSQYKLRNKYVLSLILTILSNLIYSIIVVFGVNNAIIPWNYNRMQHIYQEIIIFFLVIGANAFMFSMLISFLIRISILYQLNKLQSILLNALTISFMIIIVILSILVALDGVNLGHFKDKSSGIALIREREQAFSATYMYIILPLYIACFILFSFIYSYKMKLLKNLSTKNERNLLMPIVLKESILIISSCSISIIFGFCHVAIPSYNTQLFGTITYGFMLICTFLMFDFNHKIFYKICYYPSLFCLNICCFHAKNKNDDQLLSKQSVNKQIYTDLPQQLTINDQDNDIGNVEQITDDEQETERDSLLENDENEL